jgi:hypothetical protein
MTDRWKPFSKGELEKIQWGLQGEHFDPATGGWYEPNQQMIDEINDELNRRLNERVPESPR